MATQSQAFSPLPIPADRNGPRVLPPVILGFNAQVIQLILFREALILSSGSELSLGLSLAAWALFNGLGSLAGWASLKLDLRPGRLFRALLFLMPLVLLLSIHGARVARSLVDIPVGEHLPIPVFSCLAVLVLSPVTFLDGFLFVSALDALFSRRSGGRGTAFVYGVESAGSLVGGLVFSFFIVAVMDPYATAGLLACVNALLLRPGPSPQGRRSSWFRGAGRVAVFLGGCLFMAFGPDLNTRSERLRWEVLQPDLEWIESRETRYQNLSVLRYRDEYSLFGNGHLLFTLRASSSEESVDWDRAVFPNFAMLQHRDPGRVLMVGGGARGFLNDLLEYGPERVDWVEYDQGLVALFRKYQIPEERAGGEARAVHFHALDGRYFVKTRAPGCVDLILLDLPDPANANLNRYYTREFFAECERALGENGVLVLGLSCQPNYIGEAMGLRNGSVYRALRSVFPRVLVTPGTFSFMAAGKGDAPLSADPAELVKRYEALGIQSARFSPFLFYTWFEEDDLQWINALFASGLEKDEFGTNRDDRPVAYFADAELFTRITGTPGEEGFISRLEHILSGTGEGAPALGVKGLMVLFPAAGLVLFLLALFKRQRPGGKGGVPHRLLLYLTAATTGFSGIVLEITVLFGYQNGSGYLYSQMGVIIASYMAGLALGALVPLKKTAPRSCFFLAIAAMGLGVAFAALVLPAASRFFPGELATLLSYALVTLMLGASGGLSFRGVALALEGAGKASGGMIYTLDILGTCLGGWQAGNILIPFLGSTATLCAAGGVVALLCLFCILAIQGERIVPES